MHLPVSPERSGTAEIGAVSPEPETAAETQRTQAADPGNPETAKLPEGAGGILLAGEPVVWLLFTVGRQRLFQLEEEDDWDELFGVLKEICEDKACGNMVPYAAER